MAAIDVPGFAGGELLGRGGFGSVFRAADERHGRDVAIKILDGSLGPDERRRFDRERSSMGQLGAHPNVLPVYDSGYTDDGRAYLVMEYAPGDSLRRQIEQTGPLPWVEAVAIMSRVARGVAAAHDADILHRDIKPDNILIDAYGNPKLADFGIATVMSGATTTKGASATLAHAAPELLEGLPASPAMDIYALGSTTHALISGMPPFVRPTDDMAAPMLRRILSEPPPDLRAAGVPGAVADEIERALEKEPASRHESAGAFANALDAAVLASGEQPHDGDLSDRVIIAPGSTAADHEPAGTDSLEATGPVAVGRTVMGDSSSWLGDLNTDSPTEEDTRHRGRILLTIAALIALIGATVGALTLWGGDDEGPVEVAGATVTAPSTTAVESTTTTTTVTPSPEVSITCPAEIELGTELICAVDSSEAAAGSWRIPGFTSGSIDLDNVPGSNPIFIEPTDASFVGTTFTIYVTVVGEDGTEVEASHEFSVVDASESEDDTLDETTATTVTLVPTTAERTIAAPTVTAPATQAPTTAAPTTQAPTTAAPTTAAPTTVAAPSVSIRCPGTIALNTSVTCDIVSSNATSGTWSLPGFFGGGLALSVPGSNPIFINPTNPDVVGSTFTISATVQNSAGQTASTSASFTVSG